MSIMNPSSLFSPIFNNRYNNEACRTHRLESEFKSIERMFERDRRDGFGLSANEKKMIKGRLDRLDDMIDRGQKHSKYFKNRLERLEDKVENFEDKVDNTKTAPGSIFDLCRNNRYNNEANRMHRLENEFRSIERMYERERRDGFGLNAKEKKMIKARLDRLDNMIDWGQEHSKYFRNRLERLEDKVENFEDKVDNTSSIFSQASRAIVRAMF